MARPLINSPRMIRTGQPLTEAQIRSVAPAVYALEAHSSRGPRYAYVPTVRPLQTLLDNGWQVYEAAQQRSRAADRDPYTKHMLRLRKPGQHKTNLKDGVPEVILINGHDGSAAYRLQAGIFRFVCSNGLIVGNTMAAFIVRHTVGPQTSDEVLLAGERVVTERFPKMIESVEAMQAKKSYWEMERQLAKIAMQARYGDTVAPFDLASLLTRRREEDKAPTLWNALNVVQENIMHGGWETTSALYGRRSTVRPVERVSAVAKINGALWDKAVELLEA
jgi:hypothetical protein